MISFTDQQSEEIKQQWASIFSRYGYDEKINEIRELFPDKRTLFVSFKHISEFDNDFANSLLKSPELFLRLGQEVITKDWAPSRRSDSRRVNIRLFDIPEKDIKVDIRDIRAQNIGTIISVIGIIRKNTEVLPRLQNAAFECSQCGAIQMVPQVRGKLEEPQVCDSCGTEKPKAKFKLLPNESEFVDVEKIEVQENPETIEGGAQPQRITLIVEDDLTGNLFPGDRISAEGILIAEQKRAGNVPLTEFSIYIYVINYSKDVKEIGDVEIRPEDEKEILRLSRLDDIVDQFVQSIAPTIYGMEMIKKALVLQMFGGLRKTMKDGTNMRGDIHILLLGDPGTAKSQLLRYMTDISPRGIFAFGKGSSAAGLTAAAVRDDFGEGRWTLEAGVLVLANNGLAAIDELDKMDQTDVASMHEAMEQQSFHPDTLIEYNGQELPIGSFVDNLLENSLGVRIPGVNCEILKPYPIFIETTDFGRILRKRVIQVSRHFAPRELYRISIGDGRSVVVTEEHPFYVLLDGCIRVIPARELVPGTMIPTVSRNEYEDGREDSMISISSSGSAILEMVENAGKVIEWVPVSGIVREPYSGRWVYDIAVEDTKAIFSRGMVLHNSITISKAGIMATLKSRCSVLAAANPKFGRYDTNLSIVDQTWFPLPLLSRFDVIFKVLDEPQVARDSRLADHVLNAHRIGEVYRKEEIEANENRTVVEDVNYVPRIPKDVIRRYVAYARSRVFPVLTDEAVETIKTYYVKARNSKAESMQITARQLESTIRLSEASARVRLSPVVTRSDAELAIKIINYYLSDVASDEGKVDADIINVGMSSRQRNDLESVYFIVKKLMGKEGYALTAEVEKEAKNLGINEARTKSIINKLKSQGQVYEPSDGKLRAIS